MKTKFTIQLPAGPLVVARMAQSRKNIRVEMEKYSIFPHLHAWLIAAFLLGGSFCSHAQEFYAVSLSAAQEVPPNGSTATGSGYLILNMDHTLSYGITFQGLSGNATGAHIHGPATPGVNAGVLITLTISGGTAGTISGITAALSAAQLGYLRSGLLYVNIHTAPFPGGEIRSQVNAQPNLTAFTYQGRLASGTNVANGTYDLRFGLYYESSGANQIGTFITNSPTAVSNGLFIATLDFGALLPGAARWLEIGVRTNGGGAFTTLSPRHQITPTPYSMFANAAGAFSGAISDSQLSTNIARLGSAQVFSGLVTFSNAYGSFSGNGGGLTNVWKLGGNAGTTAADFLGTSDNQPLELKVNGTRALRLEPTAGTGGGNVIGGWSNNVATSGAVGVTIGGGYNNSVLASYSVIAGGADNIAGAITNLSLNQGATVSGGVGNQATSPFSTVAGGNGNMAWAPGATVGGGGVTAIFPNGGAFWANVADGMSAVVPGGAGNFAGGNFSFAAGFRAWATNHGTFVWSDDSGSEFVSTGADQFLIRASGGVGVGLNQPLYPLHIGSTLAAPAINFSAQRCAIEDTNSAGRAAFLCLAGNGTTYSANRVEVQVEASDNEHRGIIGTTSNHELQFRVNNVEVMKLATNGNIGISAPNPAAPLHILGPAAAPTNSLPSQNNGLLLGTYGTSGYKWIQSYGGALALNPTGNNVGIGLTSPTYQLQLAADSAAKPNGGSWANSSDARVKKNVQPLSGALDKLAQLRGVSFDWVNPADHANQTNRQTGFLAQDVEQVFPHWVREVPAAEHDSALTPHGRVKSLSLPFEFDALLVEALRELRAENATLKKTVAELNLVVSQLTEHQNGGAK